MIKNNSKYKRVELPWPDNFYEPISGEERYQLLVAAINEEDNEENQLRLKLWQYRYDSVAKNNGKPSTDKFMRLWLDLEFASGRTSSLFGGKKISKLIKQDLDNLGWSVMDEYGDLGRELLHMELVQAGRYYFELCSTDRNYNTELFGMKQISRERFFDKIVSDVHRICYKTPKAFGLQKELELFTKAMTEALEIDYPDKIKDWEDVMKKNL